MYSAVKYDPTLFLVERASVIAGRTGKARAGTSKLGAASSTWIVVPEASITLNASYTEDPDNKTLIYESETATLTLSFWDELGDVARPSDHVRVSYASKLLLDATVDSVSVEETVDAEAARHGASVRIDYTATLTGYYASTMSRRVTWKVLPRETAIQRIRRWVTVDNWTGYG
jgi:hypothetical protein